MPNHTALSPRTRRPAAPPALARHNGSAAADEEVTDGRLHRSIVTRRKIVDALTACIRDGHMAPTAEQVANRAQVGLRTVFRHFEDMGSLYRELSLNLDGGAKPAARPRAPAATWQERLAQNIRARTDWFDRVASVHLATQVHRHESARLDESVRRVVAAQRQSLRESLPPSVAGNDMAFEALDLLLSIESWIRLRREQGLSATRARAVLQQAVMQVIGERGG